MNSVKLVLKGIEFELSDASLKDTKKLSIWLIEGEEKQLIGSAPSYDEAITFIQDEVVPKLISQSEQVIELYEALVNEKYGPSQMLNAIHDYIHASMDAADMKAEDDGTPDPDHSSLKEALVHLDKLSKLIRGAL